MCQRRKLCKSILIVSSLRRLNMHKKCVCLLVVVKSLIMLEETTLTKYRLAVLYHILILFCIPSKGRN